MTIEAKHLSNPSSTGGAGYLFEAHVQAAFVILMLTRGITPAMPLWPIREIKLQGKWAGYNTDDLIVFLEEPSSKKTAKLFGQIKESISITISNAVFGEVIKAAWDDFSDTSTFNKGVDQFALITGPLSATDSESVREILDWARHTSSADEFVKKLQLAKFSSNTKKEKYAAIKHHIEAATPEKITEEQVWEFLKHFHLLGYDLDVRHGVTLSLLHSLVSQYSTNSVEEIWLRAVSEVQQTNKNAGTITLERIDPTLRRAFQERQTSAMPVELATPPRDRSFAIVDDARLMPVLVPVALAGQWLESSEADKSLLIELMEGDSAENKSVMRELTVSPNYPLTLDGDLWKITNHRETLLELSPRIFDEHLSRLQKATTEVLTEPDPMFDLEKDKRHAASIYGKKTKYSPAIRKGLTETLAIIGCNKEKLTSCSEQGKNSIWESIQAILTDASWQLWGSLNDLLPLLAECAPEEFMRNVQAGLDSDAAPFQHLFEQEGDGFLLGGNYTSGLLRALETLAWHPDYFSQAFMLLEALTEIDPGGKFANRPANSMTTVLLPWFPQTLATMDQRKGVINAIVREAPDIAWKLLISLLPNAHTTSTGTRKPEYRDWPIEENGPHVTNAEYWEQVDFYAAKTLDLALADTARLAQLVNEAAHLPGDTLDRLLSFLESDDLKLPEGSAFHIWSSILEQIIKHRRFADADWAMPEETVNRLDKIATSLSPKNPALRHRRLFSRRAYNLYEERGDYEEQINKLNQQRQDAIAEILGTRGLHAVLDFAKTVEAANDVGLALAAINDASIDKELIPSLLHEERNSLSQLLAGFVWRRFSTMGSDWLESLGAKSLPKELAAKLLTLTPFCSETWARVSAWLGDSEALYWKAAPVPFGLDDENEQEAFKKLLLVKRPNAVIRCLGASLHQQKNIPIDVAVQSLLDSLKDGSDSQEADIHLTIELIKALQDSESVDSDSLTKIELAYAKALNKYNDASPRHIESRLAHQPDFFCECIRLIYRSEKNDENPELTNQQKALASNVYEILSNWEIVPGTTNDGFDPGMWTRWLDEVKRISTESGHLTVALLTLGNVLVHAPADPSGLWIHEAIAGSMNVRDADPLRKGYTTGLFNSRGVHGFTAGKEELALAEQYRLKAHAVEAKGFTRLATALRGLAGSYEHQAEREAGRNPWG